MRCLEKRPADRWQTAEELLAQLESLATPSGGTTPTATRPAEAVPDPPRRFFWSRSRIAAAALLALAGILTFALTRAPPEVRLGRRVQLTLDPGLEIDPALSPDGKFVAFAAGPLGQTRLYVRQIDGATSVAITPEHGGFGRVPRWSPDGSRLVFLSERGLEVVPVLGGPSKLILPVEQGTWADGTWSPDGRSTAYALGDSVYVRSLDGGAARGLAGLREAHSCTWSPDGRWLACVSGNRQFVNNQDFGNRATSSVWLIPAAGGAPIRVTDDESLNMSPAWLPGHPSLLFVSNRDGGRDIYQVHLRRAGGPAGDAARLTTGLNAAEVSISADGRRLAYAAFTETSNVWALPIPTSGIASLSQAEAMTRGTQVIELFDVSPDGLWLAFDSDRGGTQQIYRVPLAGGEPEQLTAGDEPAFYPSVSPDGREIAFHRFRSGTRQIFLLPAEGGTPTQVTTGSEHYRAAEWSPDGRTLTVVKAPSTPAQEIDVLTRDAAGRWGAPRTLLKGGSIGVWAPDGRAVLTQKGGFGGFGAAPSFEIAPAGGGEGRVVMTVRTPATDVAPVGPYAYGWSADGQVVYFVGRDPRDRSVGIWSVPPTSGTPRLTVTFDDPSRPWHPYGFGVHGGGLYFTVGYLKSYVWTA
jgi:Tol biopolymer transport system component